MKTLKESFDIAKKIAKSIIDTEEKKKSGWDSKVQSGYEDEIKELSDRILFETKGWEEQKEGRALTSKAWKLFEKRTNNRSGRLRITRIKYAALFLLPLTTAALYFFLHKYPLIERPAQFPPVALEIPNPELILENGERLSLDENAQKKIKELGKKNVIASENTITYLQSESSSALQEKGRYNTLVIPHGNCFHLTLSDGSSVWLNAGSTLRYPVYFNEKERRVEITGEAYFEVSKNAEKTFIVSANGTDIRVLGTSFNVSAYGEHPVTTLVEGRIQLIHASVTENLNPGQQAVWLPEENNFRIQKVDARKFTLWKEGIFYFENASLESILEDMARWYNVKISYTDEKLKNLRFNVEIKRHKEIKIILKKIEETQKVKFHMDKGVINVYK